MAYRLATRREAQERAKPLVDELVAHLRDDDRTLSAECISHCVQFLEAIQQGATCRFRNDIQTTLGFVRRLEHRTLHVALQIAALRTVKAERPRPKA